MIIIIVVYLITAFLTYGIIFADLQRKYPNIAKEYYRRDISFAIGIAFFGPIGLFVALIMSGFCEHGFKIK